jgi:hypothetical protein
MALIKKSGGNQLIYELEDQGILVAIEKQRISSIKKYWEKYKGKSEQSDDTVLGFPFIHDEEQNSLKIDFSEEQFYCVKLLKKF